MELMNINELNYGQNLIQALRQQNVFMDFYLNTISGAPTYCVFEGAFHDRNELVITLHQKWAKEKSVWVSCSQRD